MVECGRPPPGRVSFARASPKTPISNFKLRAPRPKQPLYQILNHLLPCSADSYDTQYSVGLAMAKSSIPRGDIFVLQKTGNWNPMGYNDTLSQFDFLLQQMGLTYVDITLNHWPTSPATPTVDPVCDPAKKTSYDAKKCRIKCVCARAPRKTHCSLFPKRRPPTHTHLAPGARSLRFGSRGDPRLLVSQTTGFPTCKRSSTRACRCASQRALRQRATRSNPGHPFTHAQPPSPPFTHMHPPHPFILHPGPP